MKHLSGSFWLTPSCTYFCSRIGGLIAVLVRLLSACCCECALHYSSFSYQCEACSLGLHC